MLKADATEEDIFALCRQAKVHKFFSVCVNGLWVKFAKHFLKDSGVKVVAVVGFPLGASATAVKVYETKKAILDGADEIDMVIALGESRAQFMAQSRQAGMAEIATGVLHNIGNAVTNANVIAGTLAEKLSQSKAPSLSKAVAMMTEHKDDLPKFLSEDGRGKKLPAFLEQLAGFLNLEMAQTQDDLNALRDGLQHVKQIVAAQQDFAKGSNVVETIDLNRLVNQTISLMKGSTDKHRITVTLNAQSKLTIDCDRSKLQQILVNLLTNAKDAIRDSHSTVREIRVQLGLGDNGHVFIEIQDSGLGIAPENLNRIFANGFTTKASGHGHGLHHSATAIKEMGGTLRPSSDGPGRGATFRIELPIAVRAQQEITK
jgi:signal transduction histidine kinase